MGESKKEKKKAKLYKEEGRRKKGEELGLKKREEKKKWTKLAAVGKGRVSHGQIVMVQLEMSGKVTLWL